MEFNDKSACTEDKVSWKPLLRQVFVCSGIYAYFCVFGLFIGTLTVMIPQIRKELNSTESISVNMVSWLSSAPNYGSLPWAIICPFIAHRYGRKVSYIIQWIATMVSVMILYFGTSMTEYIVSAFIMGILPTMQLTVSAMVMTEYILPQYRGVCLSFATAIFYWAIWIANTIGTFFYWKNITIIIIVCCIYGLSVMFWPESPYWLATKGRYEECTRNHIWLKGNNEASKEELKYLLLEQKQNFKRKNVQKNQTCHTTTKLMKVYEILKSKRFGKPMIVSLFPICLYHFSGKMVFTIYALDIIKRITMNESVAYKGMLLLDGITIFGMYIGVSLTKFFKRRTFIIVSSSILVLTLCILSIYSYLKHLKIISENIYLSLFLLTAYSLTASSGPIPLCMTIVCELAPLKHRSLYFCILTLFTNFLTGVVVKVSPFIFIYFDSHGAFLFYGLISSVFVYIIYKIVPETKDKTIQEIEISLCGENIILKEHDVLLKDEDI